MTTLRYKNEPLEDGSVLAGLLMLEAYDPRREWTREESAEVCGCTVKNIAEIEKKAIRKLVPLLLERLTINQIMNIEAINELEQPIWSVITHDRVIVHRVTHKAARIALEGISGQFPRSATLVTADAAERSMQRDAANFPANVMAGVFDKQRGAI